MKAVVPAPDHPRRTNAGVNAPAVRTADRDQSKPGATRASVRKQIDGDDDLCRICRLAPRWARTAALLPARSLRHRRDPAGSRGSTVAWLQRDSRSVLADP